MFEKNLYAIIEAYEQMNNKDPSQFFSDKTNIPYYDDAMKSGEAHVEMLTPMEYFCMASKVLGIDRKGVPLIEVMIKIENSRKTIDSLKEKHNLDMPMIDLKGRWQEGIRRMAAAEELFGPKTRFPVCVVRP